MKKSISKRIRITRTGKIVRRPMGVSHSKTRKNSGLRRKKTKTLGLNEKMKSLVNY